MNPDMNRRPISTVPTATATPPCSISSIITTTTPSTTNIIILLLKFSMYAIN